MISQSKKSSFITVYDWMIRELQLGGDELIIYACTYGFNKYTGQDFFGGPAYIKKWTSSKEEDIRKAISSLSRKGYLEKKTVNEGTHTLFTYKALSLEKSIKREEMKKHNPYIGESSLPRLEEIEELDDDELYPS